MVCPWDLVSGVLLQESQHHVICNNVHKYVMRLQGELPFCTLIQATLLYSRPCGW